MINYLYFFELLKIMDLLSTRSYSNNTSADDELHEDDKDTLKELAAYYNHIIRNIKTPIGKSTNRYQTWLDGNSNKTYPSDPPPAINNNKRSLKINGDHQHIETKADKKLTTKKLPNSIHNLDYNHVSCSKNYQKIDVEPKLTFVKSKNMDESCNRNQNIAKPAYAEKTTYCRPAIDLYNQEFIYKTMERNARLKGLVRRLVLAREKENQTVAWNNYINELKNKHRCYNSDPRTIPNYMPEDTYPDAIDDYYNTRFSCKQSNQCQNLLQDFYNVSNEFNPDNHRSHVNRPLNFRPYTYENSRLCFPTSSQGRLMMLNRERPKYQFANESQNKPVSRYHGITTFADKENNYPSASMPSFKTTQPNKLLDFKKHNAIKSLSVQTDLDAFNASNNNNYSIQNKFKDKFNDATSNVERLKQKIIQSQNKVKYCSLSSIDNKLDGLIHSINTFILEIKSQKFSTDTKCEAVSCQLSNVSSLINAAKNDTFGILKPEQIVCGVVQENPRNTLLFNDEKQRDTIDEILYEEMRKSNKVKRDIEEILSKPSRARPSVHITFDIPTKETATEITDSLLKTRRSGVVVEEISSPDIDRITIAVNTDPLGLLALFRVSAETVKQILSYMPQIDYYSYLSRLSRPQMPASNEMSHYVCNICGAAFGRPSQLSDHIQQHNLGNVRDCCVCRHVLDMQRHRAGLFACQHCGQRFTRAYCRELHEQTCARSMGRSLEDTPSLMLLR